MRIERNAEIRELIDKYAFFDPKWYQQHYKDVSTSGLDPYSHFLTIGLNLGRSPNPNFDARWYLRINEDIRKAGMGAVEHYLKYGIHEGRKVKAVAKDLYGYSELSQKRRVRIKYSTWDSQREERLLELIQNSGVEPTKKASVVMPVFNREHCVSAAIESVLSQSYQNWELVIVDDGSDDRTPEIIKEYLSDPRIKYHRQERSGVSAARNRAIDSSNGELLFYLDSDNAWHPEMLHVMVAFLEATGVPAAYCGLQSIDDNEGVRFYRGDDFDWNACVNQNYIDMNTFCHTREALGEYRFSTRLRRLVDWDFILRLTKQNSAVFVPFLGVKYYDGSSARISNTEAQGKDLKALQNSVRESAGSIDFQVPLAPLAEDLLRRRQLSKAFDRRLKDLKVAYVVWDWPALSQTFVLNEIKELIARGIDVNVYYKIDPDKKAVVDFDVSCFRVETLEELAFLLRKHGRNMLHSPFAHPATSQLTWPAAEVLGIPFTFMPGGVDISLYSSMKKNRIEETSSSERCLGVITLGNFYSDFLIEQGVPPSKIISERQSVELPPFNPKTSCTDGGPQVLAIGRFVEKKGFHVLLAAAGKLPHVNFILHGYGPLEKELCSMVERMSLRNVTLAGPLDSKEALHSAYAKADLFVLPCIRATNGDLDGLPTVLIEAMSAGVPVVSTRIANIPDLVLDGVTGILCEPNDADDLANKISAGVSMFPDRRTAMIKKARSWATSYASVSRSVDTLLTTWARRSLDIVLVTYDTPNYADLNETCEILDRIYRFTSMPFNLFVVDNGSQKSFLDAIKARFGLYENFHLIELGANHYCGPASNIGIDAGSSEYVVYVCSKEGYVLQHGWERELVRQMDRSPNAVLGGNLVMLPNYDTGERIQQYPLYSKFRNPWFAKHNKYRQFRHVQGGVFILRRSVYEKVGGFNPEVPQNGMDVEYSYYLESCGYSLLQIDRVVSTTTKTWPRVDTLIDEHTYVVHPLSEKKSIVADRIIRRTAKYCVVCGWLGEQFAGEKNRSLCPNCGSSPFSRLAWRALSKSGVLQRRPEIVFATADSSIDPAAARVCRNRKRIESWSALLSHEFSEHAVTVVDTDYLGEISDGEFKKFIAEVGRKKGFVILGGCLGSRLNSIGFPIDIFACELSFYSEVQELDWRDVWAIGQMTEINAAGWQGDGYVL